MLLNLSSVIGCAETEQQWKSWDSVSQRSAGWWSSTLKASTLTTELRFTATVRAARITLRILEDNPSTLRLTPSPSLQVSWCLSPTPSGTSSSSSPSKLLSGYPVTLMTPTRNGQTWCTREASIRTPTERPAPGVTTSSGPTSPLPWWW